MKFRDWKKEIQKTNFDIPDVLDKIKIAAYEREIKYIKPNIKQNRIFTFKRVTYAFTSFLLIFALIITISTNINFNNEKIYSIDGDLELSNINSIEQLENMLADRLDNKQPNNNSNTIFDFFKKPSDESNQSIASIPRDTLTLVKGTSNTDIIQVDDNYIYYASSNNFYVIKSEEGHMEVVYEEQYSTNNVRILYNNSPYINELYVTDKYIVLIYTDDIEDRFSNSNAYWQIRDNYGPKHLLNKVIVYDKNTYEKVKTYQIEGNLLEHRINNESLYLITHINFSEYMNRYNQIPLPKITIDELGTNVTFNDIQFTSDSIGQSYTVLSTIYLGDLVKTNQTITLSDHLWNIIYFSNDNLYLAKTFHNLYNPRLSNAQYTIIFKYNLQQSNINYSSSTIYMGKIFDKDSLNEHNGYLRVVSLTESSDLNFSTNKILLFKEVNVRGFKALRIISDINIGSNYEVLKNVRFQENFATISTFTNHYTFDLRNPSNLKLMSQINEPITNLSLTYIDKENAITIEYTNTSLYLITFYKTVDNQIQQWEANADYIISSSFIEAINNRKAIYINQDNDLRLFGFSTQKMNYSGVPTSISYNLFIVDTENFTYEIKTFSHGGNDYIRRLFHINEEQTYFYTISNNKVISYNENFEIISSLNL